MSLFVALSVGAVDEVILHLNVVAFALMAFTHLLTVLGTHSPGHPLHLSLSLSLLLALQHCDATHVCGWWRRRSLNYAQVARTFFLFYPVLLLWTSFWSIAVWKVPDSRWAGRGREGINGGTSKDWELDSTLKLCCKLAATLRGLLFGVAAAASQPLRQST